MVVAKRMDGLNRAKEKEKEKRVRYEYRSINHMDSRRVGQTGINFVKGGVLEVTSRDNSLVKRRKSYIGSLVAGLVIAVVLRRAGAVGITNEGDDTYSHQRTA